MSTSAQNDAQPDERPGKRIRLTIDISPELRRRIKIAAAQQDTSTRRYIERILDAAVPEQSDEQARELPQRHPVTDATKQRLLAARERVNQGQTFSDSVEIIRQMREERTEHLMRVVEGRYDEDQSGEGQHDE